MDAADVPPPPPPLAPLLRDELLAFDFGNKSSSVAVTTRRGTVWRRALSSHVCVRRADPRADEAVLLEDVRPDALEGFVIVPCVKAAVSVRASRGGDDADVADVARMLRRSGLSLGPHPVSLRAHLFHASFPEGRSVDCEDLFKRAVSLLLQRALVASSLTRGVHRVHVVITHPSGVPADGLAVYAAAVEQAMTTGTRRPEYTVLLATEQVGALTASRNSWGLPDDRPCGVGITLDCGHATLKTALCLLRRVDGQCTCTTRTLHMDSRMLGGLRHDLALGALLEAELRPLLRAVAEKVGDSGGEAAQQAARILTNLMLKCTADTLTLAKEAISRRLHADPDSEVGWDTVLEHLSATRDELSTLRRIVADNKLEPELRKHVAFTRGRWMKLMRPDLSAMLDPLVRLVRTFRAPIADAGALRVLPTGGGVEMFGFQDVLEDYKLLVWGALDRDVDTLYLARQQTHAVAEGALAHAQDARSMPVSVCAAAENM
jgi:hypothetical protein